MPNVFVMAMGTSSACILFLKQNNVTRADGSVRASMSPPFSSWMRCIIEIRVCLARHAAAADCEDAKADLVEAADAF